MTNIASVAEVQQAGITIEAEEAVAIAQQLIDTLRAGADITREGPYGPPATATVYLVDDGSVMCRGCDATPAVSEMAILLQAMLPRSTRVPGGLRYSIARALLDVDVAPYDSLDDFSEALSRYERGPRDEIVRRLLQRVDTRRALVRPAAAGDRRRHPHTTELRRALREADARLYLQKVTADTMAMTVASRHAQRPRHSRAAAACVALGLALIAAGELIDSRGSHLESTAPPLVVSAPAAAPIDSYELRDIATEESRTGNAPEGSDVPERTIERRRPANPDSRVPEKRTRATRRMSPSARAHSTHERRGKTAESRGVLDRLRLKWLRNMFTSL